MNLRTVESREFTRFNTINPNLVNNQNIQAISNLPNNYVNDKAKKTGTTICGVITKDGVVLSADTRATAGTFVADKNCFKLHKITESIWCAGAGVAADLEHLTDKLNASMRLFKAELGIDPPVIACVTRISKLLHEYNGQLIVALIIGGVNPDGTTSLWYVDADGYKQQHNYMTMGSGCLYARAIIEDGYKENMTIEEGIELTSQAIRAGVMNDMGSGSHVDVVVINKLDSHNPILKRPYLQPVIHQKQSISDYTDYVNSLEYSNVIVKKLEPFDHDRPSEYQCE